MKLVFISDTHSHHKQINIPDGDILIHSGDLTTMGRENEIRKFNKWIGELPHTHKLVVPGNHDYFFETNDRKWIDTICTNFTYLINKEIVIDGYKFYGSPYQPEFCSWAFNLPRYGDSLKNNWDLIPEDTDVLITHSPPYGILDQCPESQGCQHLFNKVMEVKPKIHTFGHIHEGYGKEEHEGISFINSAIMDGDYNPVNKPIVMEI